MWQTGFCSHAKFIHLSSPSPDFALKIGRYTLTLSRRNKVKQTHVPGAVCCTNPPLCIPPSLGSIVRIFQVDDITRVITVDKNLNEALLQYGNVPPADSLGWYDPWGMLIGLNNVYMCGVASDLEVKLAEARNCVLQTRLKEIAFDLLAYRTVRPHLDAYRDTLFHVLLTMLQTLIRVRLDCQGQVAIEGCEHDFILCYVNTEAQRLRIKARGCKDNQTLDVFLEWADIHELRGFAFDDGRFWGRRPVSTWEWFSRAVRQGPPQDEPPEYVDGGLDLDQLLARVMREKEEATAPHDGTMVDGGLDLDLLARY